MDSCLEKYTDAVATICSMLPTNEEKDAYNDHHVLWIQHVEYLKTRGREVIEAGVDFLAFPPINIGERYKIIFDLRKVISQSEIPFDLKQLHQLSVGL